MPTADGWEAWIDFEGTHHARITLSDFRLKRLSPGELMVLRRAGDIIAAACSEEQERVDADE